MSRVRDIKNEKSDARGPYSNIIVDYSLGFGRVDLFSVGKDSDDCCRQSAC